LRAVLIAVNFLLPYLGNFLNNGTKLLPLIAVILLNVFLIFLEENVLFGYLYIRGSIVAFIIIIIIIIGLIIHSIYTLGEVRATFRNCCVGLIIGILFSVSVFFVELRQKTFVLAADTLEPYGSGAVLIAEESSVAVGDVVVAGDSAVKGRSHFGILGGLPGWTLARTPDGSFDSCNNAGECVSTHSMCVTISDDVETLRLGPKEAVIFKIRRVGSIDTHVQEVENIRRVNRYFAAKDLVEFAKSLENSCSGIEENWNGFTDKRSIEKDRKKTSRTADSVKIPICPKSIDKRLRGSLAGTGKAAKKRAGTML